MSPKRDQGATLPSSKFQYGLTFVLEFDFEVQS